MNSTQVAAPENEVKIPGKECFYFILPKCGNLQQKDRPWMADLFLYSDYRARKALVMKKNIFFFLLICSFFLIQPLWGQSIKDFDRIIDFSITLEELSDALEKNDYSRVDKNKFVILNGTASVIRPEKSFFFLLNPDDFLNSASFIKKLKEARDGVSQFLFDELPTETRDEIQAYTNTSKNEEDLIRNITNGLNKIFRKKSIYTRELFSGIILTGQLKEFAQKNLETEEMAFVNRLLMEAAYPLEIKKVSIQVEVVYGVWIGYDEVKSFKSIIEFKGPECFKIFVRKKPEDASGEMIDVNSIILVIAKIQGFFTQTNGEKGWLLEGMYIREIQ